MKNNSNAGMTLLEVIIAVSIFSISAIVLLQSFVTSSRINKKSNTYLEATSTAQNVMEEIKAKRFQEVALAFNYPVDLTTNSSRFTFLDSQLSEIKDNTLEIKEVARDDDGNYINVRKYNKADGDDDSKVTASVISHDSGKTYKFNANDSGKYYYSMSNVKNLKETFDVLVEFDGGDDTQYRKKTISNNEYGKNDYLSPNIAKLDTKKNAFLIMEKDWCSRTKIEELMIKPQWRAAHEKWQDEYDDWVMSTAYIKVLETYSQDSDVTSADATLDELRQASFKELFVKELTERLKKGTDTSQYDLQKINGYLDLTNETEFDNAKETVIVTNPTGKSPSMIKDVKDGILLKNLKAIYVDAQGRASIIETDIRLGIPKIQFPTPSTLPDLMNMIVVANKGIVCEGTDITQETVIQGSVYAGLLKDKQSDQMIADGSDKVSVEITPGAKLSVSSGDKFVCQGNINVGAGGRFSSGSIVSVWAQGINLTSATVELLGKTYLADDLTVNTGKNSNVKIEGEYYGFGAADSAKTSKIYHNNDDKEGVTPVYDYKGRSDSSLSSAIVINGKNTTMDLSGAQRIMLAGKNYIASTKIPSERGNKSDIMTGESLTVKGTQLAYLVPAELIGDGTQTNPMTYDQYVTLTANDKKIVINDSVPVTQWGNQTLKQIGVDESKPVQEVFYNDNVAGGGFVYFYLNFTDSTKAATFMQTYYAVENIKTNMDEYLSFYFGENAGVKVNDPQAYLRYITNGNVLSSILDADGKTQNGHLYEATDTRPGKLLSEEQVKYQNMWYTLNRKMISSYDLLKKDVKDTEVNSHDERQSNRTVFDNLVNKDGMRRFINEKGTTSSDGYKEYRFNTEKDNAGLTAIMADNENIDTLTINSETAKKLRLVVCTGDVKIDVGVTFNGIIMAQGKITLGSGAKLISSPLEAAKVFQAQMDAEAGEKISPKDFFWEGDQYVLGNSTATGTTSGNNLADNTYDLAQCVTYENWKKK